MDDLYREVIIEHYKNPAFRGRLNPKDISFEDSNPLCGDHIMVPVLIVSIPMPFSSNTEVLLANSRNGSVMSSRKFHGIQKRR